MVYLLFDSASNLLFNNFILQEFYAVDTEIAGKKHIFDFIFCHCRDQKPTTDGYWSSRSVEFIFSASSPHSW